MRKLTQINDVARKLAPFSEFTGYCPAHGSTLFDTATGACLSCLAKFSAVDLPVRLQYEQSGARFYPGECETHGPGLFSIPSARCPSCRKKTLADPFRKEARRAGRETYEAYCERHGAFEPHWTATGYCATCYTVSGRDRLHRAPGNPKRAEARRAGLTKYLDECAIHGAFEFSVDTGRCLGCHTTTGKRRKI